MLANPTETEAAKRALVRTYDPPGYADPWDCIQDYERVLEYSAEHPNKGSQAVSTALELKRGRIRPWMEDGSQPDCYRGLQTALDNTWIVEDWSQAEAKALNCLAAWLLSSGSINETWVPTFVTDDDREEIETLRGYARSANVRLERTRSDDEDRPMEWRPNADASVLGRVLYTWTNVRGDKSADKVHFPEYLSFAPHHVVLQFIKTYVEQRGVRRTDRGEFVQIAAIRSDAFREALATCLERVVSDPAAIRSASWPVRIYPPALEELEGYPDLGAGRAVES